MNPGPLSWAVALQLFLIAAAKWRTRNSNQDTLLGAVLPRVPALATSAADVVCAVLLLFSATYVFGAVLLIVLLCGGALLDITFHDRDLPCGCFGAPNPGLRYRARERTVRVLLGSQAVVVAFDLLPGDVAVESVIAALATALLTALLPGGLTMWSRSVPLTARTVLQRLGVCPELERWRPYLLSDTPASVTVTGQNAAEVVLDAWHDEGPMLLVVRVTGHRVRVAARDADTLELLRLP